MTEIRRLLICRHGERLDHVDPGWCETAPEPFDPPLSNLGQQQVRRLAEWLSAWGVQRVVASPFRRTIESAQTICEVLNRTFEVDDGLCEWQNPAWFTERWCGNRRWVEEASRCTTVRAAVEVPRYPETEAEAEARCAKAVQSNAERSDGVLVVAHENGVVGSIGTLTGFRPPRVRTGEGFVLRYTGLWQLEAISPIS